MDELDKLRDTAKEMCSKAAAIAERCNLENMQERFNVLKVLEGDRWAEGESAVALFDKSGITLVHVTSAQSSLQAASPALSHPRPQSATEPDR